MNRPVKARAGALSLGSNVVEILLPQRRPMLMVDRVEAFFCDPAPTVEASRFISASEIFFEGHFPGLHLWPGCLTIEGMGQTGALLTALLGVRRAAEAQFGDPECGFEALRNLELGFRMHPGFRADVAERFRSLAEAGRGLVAVSASVDVKLLRPVFAGQRLDYRASLVHEMGDMLRFQVEASVDGVSVASGTMTGARAARPMISGVP
jgi:3-hydroxyacyl-[acyl-carrier-protein] dehydratase